MDPIESVLWWVVAVVGVAGLVYFGVMTYLVSSTMDWDLMFGHLDSNPGGTTSAPPSPPPAPAPELLPPPAAPAPPHSTATCSAGTGTAPGTGTAAALTTGGATATVGLGGVDDCDEE